MAKVRLLSQPTCGPCRSVESGFRRAGVDFEKVDVTQDDVYFKKLKDLGYTGTPVVIYEEEDGSEAHFGAVLPEKMNRVYELHGKKD